jgi:hypothetical protein
MSSFKNLSYTCINILVGVNERAHAYFMWLCIFVVLSYSSVIKARVGHIGSSVCLRYLIQSDGAHNLEYAGSSPGIKAVR